MVSVCIPTYNGEKYIRQQLDSILCQLTDIDEIIISDDSSGDHTTEIIKSYGDPRIRLIENCTFKSPIFNLENALKNAKGNYIFLSDQDDIWLPDKVKVSISYLKDYDLVVSDCKLIDEQGTVISDSFFKMVDARSGYFHNLIKNGYLGCCIAFNSGLMKKVLPFPGKIAMHDIWIGLMAEIEGKTYFYRAPLILYRRHSANATPYTSGKSNNPLAYRVKYRIDMAILTLLRHFKII